MPKGGRQTTYYCANATRKFLFDFAFATIRSWGARPEDRRYPRLPRPRRGLLPSTWNRN